MKLHTSLTLFAALFAGHAFASDLVVTEFNAAKTRAAEEYKAAVKECTLKAKPEQKACLTAAQKARKDSLVAAGKARDAAVKCTTCGKVEAITAREVTGDSKGIGAVGGAVAGGLIGNKVSEDSDKRGVVTAVGAIGGALLGNVIEKKARTQQVWDVLVKLNTGKTETVTVTEEPTLKVGDKVKVAEGKVSKQ